ncbi:DUF465 domain-containing protein [bacterium]|nr:DUF465 domain-containing protein [bacterium]
MDRHILSLKQRHRDVHEAIEQELNRREPDWAHILKLKKLRLMLKDRIQRLSTPVEVRSRDPAACSAARAS